MPKSHDGVRALLIASGEAVRAAFKAAESKHIEAVLHPLRQPTDLAETASGFDVVLIDVDNATDLQLVREVSALPDAPAVIAIALHTAGALGKLFSEVAENADQKPVEGLSSVGATWGQKMWLGVIPQVAPDWLSYVLQRFEVNVRASAILGFVGSGGIGSSGHLAGEFYSQTAGVRMTHVPYKGDGPAMNELLGGQLQVMFTAPNVAVPHAKSGRLRILAVTSRERLAALPDVPTMIESGVPDFEYLGWIIAFAPAATPLAVIQALQAAWAKARTAPGLRSKLDDLGMQAPERLASADAVVTFLRNEQTRMARIVKAAGIKPE
jgi:hypothetical protein